MPRKLRIEYPGAIYKHKDDTGTQAAGGDYHEPQVDRATLANGQLDLCLQLAERKGAKSGAGDLAFVSIVRTCTACTCTKGQRPEGQKSEVSAGQARGNISAAQRLFTKRR